MNELEWYIVDLLQGHLSYNDQSVQVVKNFNQSPSRPVVTLDIQSVTNQQILNDPSRAEKHFVYRADININLWCDNESQRQELVEQIQDCFYKEQTLNYIYCQNYTDGNCSKLQTVCPAVTLANGRCPEPEDYGFTRLQYRHNIVQGSLMVEPPFELDEVSEHPPLLRSVFRCTADYVVVKGVAILTEEVSLGGVELVHTAPEVPIVEPTDPDTPEIPDDSGADEQGDASESADLTIPVGEFTPRQLIVSGLDEDIPMFHQGAEYEWFGIQFKRKDNGRIVTGLPYDLVVDGEVWASSVSERISTMIIRIPEDVAPGVYEYSIVVNTPRYVVDGYDGDHSLEVIGE